MPPWASASLRGFASGRGARALAKALLQRSLSAKEAPQLLRGFGLEHAGGHRGVVVETGVGRQIEERSAAARVGVGAAEDDALDPGVDRRARAHGAGLQRDHQRAAVKPPGAHAGRSPTQGEHFRVRGGVGPCLAAVGATAEHFPVAMNQGAHRHLAQGGGFIGEFQGAPHHRFVDRVHQR